MDETAAANDSSSQADAVTGFDPANIDPEVVLNLVNQYGVPVLKALVLLLAALIAASWVRRLVQGGLTRAKFDPTLTVFFGTAARVSVLVLAAILILGVFGVETASFAALIAAAGLAIGLAFQGALGNLAAGLMLLTFRPFKVGDVVVIGGITGKVIEIGLFSTAMDSFDNRRFILPNGRVFGQEIENITFHPKRRVDVAVGVSYSASIDDTRRILVEAATGVEGRTQEDEPKIVLLELGDSAVSWSVRVWATNDVFWDVKQALTRAVKMNLDRAGISIPFPQMDVHLKRDED